MKKYYFYKFRSVTQTICLRYLGYSGFRWKLLHLRKLGENKLAPLLKINAGLFSCKKLEHLHTPSGLQYNCHTCSMQKNTFFCKNNHLSFCLVKVWSFFSSKLGCDCDCWHKAVWTKLNNNSIEAEDASWKIINKKCSL